MNSSIKLNFIVALSAEAHPIIAHYKLKRIHSVTPFEFYKNENIQLIVCGIGKTNAAVATGYLAGISDDKKPQVWLNVGIAGGDVASLGDVVIAHSICDDDTGKLYYPSLCFDHQLPQAKIVTVNNPAVKYRGGVLFDMEASGFFAAANRFSTAEIVHCCKIVSDCSDSPVEKIDKKMVSGTVQDGLKDIDSVVKSIVDIATVIVPDMRVESVYEQLVNRYHFTESQKHTLKLYLQNWISLTNTTKINLDELYESRNSKTVLTTLQRMIGSLPVHY